MNMSKLQNYSYFSVLLFPQCSLPAAFCSSWLQVSFKRVKTTPLLKGIWVVFTPIFLLWWWAQLGLIYDFYSCFGVMVFFLWHSLPAVLYLFCQPLSFILKWGGDFAVNMANWTSERIYPGEKGKKHFPGLIHHYLEESRLPLLECLMQEGKLCIAFLKSSAFFRVTGMKSFILWTDDAPLGIFSLKIWHIVDIMQGVRYLPCMRPNRV